MKFRNYLMASVSGSLALHCALAQPAVDLTGSFPVSESWSATLQVGTGSGIATRYYSGTVTGTLIVSNGVYSLINRTGAPSLPRAKRTITYDSYSDDYYIGGTDPGIGGGDGGFFVEVPLTFFAVTVPLGTTGGFSGGDPSQSSPFASSGPALGDLSGSGTYVDVNAPDDTSGYFNELDWSSTAVLTLPPVPPTITTPPIGQVVAVGADVSFSAAASGTPSPAYKWKHNGTTIGNGGEYGGATTPTLTITAAQTRDAGTYTVVASNSKGSATASATLTVVTGQVFTNLYNFPGGAGGAVPTGEVVLSANVLFGTSFGGGASDGGMVFALNSDGSGFTNLHSFSTTFTNSNDVNTNYDGAYSCAGLAVSGGNLYGTTESGGVYGSGTVFALNANGAAFASLHNLSQSITNGYGLKTNSDGLRPVTGLILSGNTLYGTASYGGVAGWGTLFAVNTDGTGFTTLYDFTNGDDGFAPAGSLILSGGTLYGTASEGGATGNGTIFALNTNSDALAVLYTFSEIDSNGFNADGANPQTCLILSNNTLYGTAAFGGNAGNGTLFAVNLDGGNFRTLHSFSPSLGGEIGYYDVTNGDGAAPYGGLTLSDNTLYGTASGGGSAGDGTVFSVNTDGTGFTVLYTFTPMDINGFNSDGASPEAGLTLSGNTLYGTAASGGAYGWGTVFSLSLAPASIARGSLQVSITPLGASTAGAQWQVDNGTLQKSGTTVTLAVGNHIVSFTPAPGWMPPGEQTVAIADGATSKITGVYVQGSPRLTITSPKSGQSVSNDLLLVKGTVTDKVPVDGVYYQLNTNSWTLATPSNSWSNWTASVTLNPGPNTISAYALDASGAFSPTNTVNFVYVVTGALQVTLYPPAAVNDGAQWRVDAGAFHNNGATVSNLLVGNHALSFKSVSGFATPSNQAVSIASNQVTLATGAYLDTNRPTLTIVSPTPNLRLSNTVFTVTGKAADNVAVSTVLYQLNYSGWSDAGSTNHWTNWTAIITPAPGSNTLQACALDTSANYSLTNTVHFTYIPNATLTVRTNGLGSITPVDNGKLLYVNTNYTLKAAPANNWLFSNWVGGATAPYPALTNGPTLTFAMLSNLVLQANFVTNPFPAIAGSFNGLFYQTNGSPVTEQSSGFVTVTIASTSKGAYTAKLLLDGGSYSFTGAFDLNGNSVTNLARKGKSPLALTLHVDLNTLPPATVMTGTVTATNWAGPSGLMADLAVFNGKTIVATNYAGKYTLVLPGSAAPSISPGGDGAATFTNNLAGTAVLGGALGDGTSLGSQSVPISQDGLVPVYVPLYSGQGSVFGWLAFSNLPPKTLSGGLTWFKLSGPAKSLYSNGFTFQTNIIGSVYVPSATNLLALTNGTLTITDPGQGIDLVYTNVTVVSNKLSYTAPPTNQLIVTFTPASGTMTVSFRPTGAKANITAQGVVLQGALADPSLKAAGWFIGTNQTGSFELETQ
jgi:uncharacterized repeat protein (TIGR03803 family)